MDVSLFQGFGWWWSEKLVRAANPSLLERRTLCLKSVRDAKRLRWRWKRFPPSESEDKATASLNGSSLCSSPSWPLVAIAKWNDDFFFFLSAQSTGCRGLSKTWDYPKRRDWLQIVLVFHAVSLRWAQVLLPTVTLKAWWLLQIVPCCLIADGFHLSSGFLLLFVCFFTMIDREALTHGSKTHWNKQQHKAL